LPSSQEAGVSRLVLQVVVTAVVVFQGPGELVGVLRDAVKVSEGWKGPCRSLARMQWAGASGQA